MNDINESNGGCEEVKETPICWICHGGCEDEKLISPCLCRGSMGYVHLTCLNQWRNANKNMDYFRCRICLFKYRLRQKTYLKFIKLNYISETLTYLSFIVLAKLCGVGVEFFSLTPLPSYIGRKIKFQDNYWQTQWNHFSKGTRILGLFGSRFSAFGFIRATPVYNDFTYFLCDIFIFVGVLRFISQLRNVISRHLMNILDSSEVESLNQD